MPQLYRENRREILAFTTLLSLLLLIASTRNFYFSTFYNLLLVILMSAFYLKDLRRRLAALIFTFSMSMFLVFRPVIDILTGFVEHLPYHYRFSTGFDANILVASSILCIALGQRIYELWLLQKEVTVTKSYPFDEIRGIILRYAWPFYIISALALLARNLERIIYRLNHSYTSLYADFTSSLPFVVIGFASLSAVLMIVIVITSKSKRSAYGALLIYLALTGSLMLAGVRADFSKTLLFIGFILLQRDLLKTTFSRKVFIRGVIILVILVFLLMGLFFLVNVAREDFEVQATFSVPLQFLYDQGISFMAIVRGPEAVTLEMFQDKHYTFGPFIDTLDGTKSMSAYSEEFLLEGNSLASDIAYYLYGENALLGYGLGSSYLIEVFLDFHYPGAIIYSLLLGMLLGSMSQISWRHYIIDAIKLRFLMELFYIPRAPALQFVLNVMMPQFLVPLLGLLFLGYMTRLVKRRRAA